MRRGKTTGRRAVLLVPWNSTTASHSLAPHTDRCSRRSAPTGSPSCRTCSTMSSTTACFRISITADRVKYRNLVREPWAALHVTTDDFFAYVVLEADVELTPIVTTPDDPTVPEHIDHYRAVVGEHENWDAYRGPRRRATGARADCDRHGVRHAPPPARTGRSLRAGAGQFRVGTFADRSSHAAGRLQVIRRQVAVEPDRDLRSGVRDAFVAIVARLREHDRIAEHVHEPEPTTSSSTPTASAVSILRPSVRTSTRSARRCCRR